MLACPAALYKFDEDGDLSFDYAGALNAARAAFCVAPPSPRVLGIPQPTMGIEYRQSGGLPGAPLPCAEGAGQKPLDQPFGVAISCHSPYNGGGVFDAA